MKFELLNPEKMIIGECSDRRMRRYDVAVSYQICLRIIAPDSEAWKRINQAIISRWSLAGLEWIKARAWERGGKETER